MHPPENLKEWPENRKFETSIYQSTGKSSQILSELIGTTTHYLLKSYEKSKSTCQIQCSCFKGKNFLFEKLSLASWKKRLNYYNHLRLNFSFQLLRIHAHFSNIVHQFFHFVSKGYQLKLILLRKEIRKIARRN